MKIKRTESPYLRLSVEFGRIYNLHPKKAESILRDIFFYVDFFNRSTVSNDRRHLYKKVSDILYMHYHRRFNRWTIKRWFQKVSSCTVDD